MHIATWKHRVKKHEVVPDTDSIVDGRVTRYRLRIEDDRIQRSANTEVYVKSVAGWEPAANFSHLGNGTVFSTIRLDSGTVELEFTDNANQSVHDPTDMLLRFYVRPGYEELVGARRNETELSE